MRRRIAVLTLVAAAVAPHIFGDDYYLIGAFAQGAGIDACSSFLFQADTAFLNLSNDVVTATLLGVSNTPPLLPDLKSFTIPPGRVTSTEQQVRGFWQPRSLDGVWIYHISTSGPVIVDSELFASQFSPGGQLNGCKLFLFQIYGKTRLPVFRALIPAGQAQVITGLTLGDVQSHINVFVYNAATSSADATIEIHRACDGVLLVTQHGSLIANTIREFDAVVGPDTSSCPAPSGAGLNHLAYAIVTVSQPSLAFASMIPDLTIPTSTLQVSGGSQP